MMFANNESIPFGGWGAEGVWSLLSLIVSLVAVVMSVLLFVRPFICRRRKQADDRWGYERWEHESEYLHGYDGREERAEAGKRRKRVRILRIAAIIAGILVPVVWLWLDNSHQPMAWVNRWTFFVIKVFLIHLILFVVYRLRKGDEE